MYSDKLSWMWCWQYIWAKHWIPFTSLFLVSFLLSLAKQLQSDMKWSMVSLTIIHINTKKWYLFPLQHQVKVCYTQIYSIISTYVNAAATDCKRRASYHFSGKPYLYFSTRVRSPGCNTHKSIWENERESWAEDAHSRWKIDCIWHSNVFFSQTLLFVLLKIY